MVTILFGTSSVVDESVINSVVLRAAVEGAAAEDQHGSGLYPEFVSSLFAAHMARQREAVDEDPHTRDRCRFLPAR